MPKYSSIPFFKKLLFMLSTYYVVMLFFWLFIFYSGSKDQFENYVFGLFLAFMPLLGFVYGVYVSSHWGYFKSKLGKAILFIALGQLFWGIATIIFAYHNLVLHQEVPYPSIADLFYLLLYVFYVSGAYNLAHATGARSSGHSKTVKFLIPVIPILAFLLTYLLYLKDYISTISTFSFEVMLDLVYPLLDSVLLSFTLITLILSYKYLGGKYRKAVYFLLTGFVVEFIADSAFTITTSNESFFVANWVDLLFLSCNFIVAVSIVLMSAERILNKPNLMNDDGK